ncbi:MAG: ABC transporter ATP-binding protein, partial [Actinobacteria bacterium]
MEDVVPPGGREGSPPTELETPPEELPQIEGAIRLIRRGLRETPELRAGLGYTLGLAMALTAGRLLVPILVQQIFDRGLNGPGGFRPRFVYGACLVAAGVVALVYLAGRTTYRRLVRASETALATLRVRAFEHIHKLSIAAQTAEKRGAFVSRVTADVDTIGQFLEWGGMSWITSTALMFGTAVAMFVYSWQLALVVLLAVSPLFLVLRLLQKGMLRAYDRVRTRVGETLSAVSESLMGAAVVRAYGLEEPTNRRLKEAIRRRYKAEMYGARFQATIFPMADLFGAAAVASVLAVGVTFGPRWGLTF